jgi:hypothetical protein
MPPFKKNIPTKEKYISMAEGSSPAIRRKVRMMK